MMGRPRKHDPDLPERVYFRHNAYYYVSPSGQWHRLSDDREVALRIVGSVASTDDGLLRHLREAVLPATKRNAKSRNREFALSTDDVIAAAVEAGWRCAMTGIRFSLDQVGRRKPYAPSVDRIDCSKGYEPSNIRLVCVAVNLALADWGDEVFDKIALHYARRLCEERYSENA